MPDGILRLLFSIVVVALVVWLLLAFLPLPYPFGTVIVVVAVLACVVMAWRGLGGSSL